MAQAFRKCIIWCYYTDFEIYPSARPHARLFLNNVLSLFSCIFVFFSLQTPIWLSLKILLDSPSCWPAHVLLWPAFRLHCWPSYPSFWKVPLTCFGALRLILRTIWIEGIWLSRVPLTTYYSWTSCPALAYPLTWVVESRAVHQRNNVLQDAERYRLPSFRKCYATFLTEGPLKFGVEFPYMSESIISPCACASACACACACACAFSHFLITTKVGVLAL